MIVLPNTPPLPTQLTNPTNLSSEIITQRASLLVPQLSSYNESIRYVLSLEEYLKLLIKHSQTMGLSNTIISTNIPWSNVSHANSKTNIFKNKNSKSFSWSLLNEIILTLISISLIYNRIASHLINETIDKEIEPPEKPEDYNENWKTITKLYKNSISIMLYAEILQSENSTSLNEGSVEINPMLISFVKKISDISIQMSILSKFLWINRYLMNKNQDIKTENNITLTKVAIYCMNELNIILNILNDFQTSFKISSESKIGIINLNYTDWDEYLNIFKKYTNSYAGFFLALQNYKENKLGNALGLIQYSLISLQSKTNLEPQSSLLNKKITLQKFKNKLNSRKNDAILSNLNSISTLNLNKSSFNDKSGIILNDLSYLYDQLIKLNIKFLSENNTLQFDNIIHWSSIEKDSKWPIGCKIPISKIEPYNPLNNDDNFENINNGNNEYAGRGAYY
ncbi:uncharacterized protein KGF55_003173 [Candida pseudojiufengensis]|uniref:uncharacterized protein n=1 Tax=Candida pseudojiufengensis TaxID=497109 RepID=UPI002224E35E|nr:uncharacterized protein KGF55_003173 [Candida pseudojiufengensis]KAI5962097.1 hypothetical protein KGF55_003173 [Candida pseudojiufengensis]